jgi:hypothetical protein
LAENPYRAAEYEYDVRYRKAIVDDYLIFYRVDDDKRLVSIFRILHGARNILSILKWRGKMRDKCEGALTGLLLRFLRLMRPQREAGKYGRDAACEWT